MNQCTAKLLPDTNNVMKPTFDLVNVSEGSKKFRSVINQNVPGSLFDKCYDFSRVDICRINVSHNTRLDHVHNITVYDHVSNLVKPYRCFCSYCLPEGEVDDIQIDEEHQEDTEEIITDHISRYQIFPSDTHVPVFCGPVYGFHIKSNKKMIFRLMMSNKSLGQFLCDSETWIYFEDTSNHFKGSQDYHLNESQKKNSINLSRIAPFCISVVNNFDESINLNVDTLSFVTYNKRDLKQTFVC